MSQQGKFVINILMTCHFIKHENTILVYLLHMVRQIDVYILFSEMCLDQALNIHAMMKQKQCPYHLLHTVSGMIYSLQFSGYTDIIY